MRRRDLLKSATLAVATQALGSIATAAQPNPAQTSAGKRLGKIALEEHFMVP
jgi:hypothetical protein